MCKRTKPATREAVDRLINEGWTIATRGVSDLLTLKRGLGLATVKKNGIITYSRAVA